MKQANNNRSSRTSTRKYDEKKKKKSIVTSLPCSPETFFYFYSLLHTLPLPPHHPTPFNAPITKGKTRISKGKQKKHAIHIFFFFVFRNTPGFLLENNDRVKNHCSQEIYRDKWTSLNLLLC